MSVGTVVGAVVGGVAGFLIPGGGFALAAALAGVGAGVGAYLDPLTPDIGKPDIQELSVTTAKEGEIIPELLGISQITGNIIHYWGNSSAQVKTGESGGKGGGGGQDIEETHYYLSWLQAICLGPVDYLYTIYKEEDVVWAGYLERPESGGEQTITLTNYTDTDGNGSAIGTMTFFYGTDDQQAKTEYLDGIDDETLNINYKGLCYAFFDNIDIGTYNRAPIFKFVIAKRPKLSFSNKETIYFYDYNPAHAIWWILEQLSDLPTSFLDETSFKAAASTLYDEGFGINILLNKNASAGDYVDNILRHIDAVKFYDTDGKLKIKLLREDTDRSEMTLINEHDLVEKPVITRGTWLETTNEVRVTYPLRTAYNFDATYEPITSTTTTTTSTTSTTTNTASTTTTSTSSTTSSTTTSTTV